MLQPRQELSPVFGQLWDELIVLIEGGDRARCLAIASFTMVVYDYFLTLDDEIRYFWTGKWSMSRVLYLLNRYLPPISLTLGLISFLAPGLSTEFCDRTIRTCFILDVIAMAVAQAVLVLRIWYLYRHNRAAQILAVTSFVVCIVAEFVTLCLSIADLHSEIIVAPGVHILEIGCKTPPPSRVWRMFIPHFILHTICYLFTAYRGIRNRSITAEAAPLMRRLLRDGGMLYFVVFFSVGFSTIGAAMTSQPLINLPAIYSNFVLSMTSICISRVMLGIRSLAAELISDPAWLLNNAELSRVCWKKGPNAGELIIDVDEGDNDKAYFGVLDIRREIEYEFDVESKGESSSGKTIDRALRTESPA